jgi:hypothetical protein
MVPFGSTVVFGAGNFTVASDTFLGVLVLTSMNCFPVLDAWLVTTPIRGDELITERTATLAVFALVSATVEGVLIGILPPDVNELRNISLHFNVSGDSSWTVCSCLV